LLKSGLENEFPFWSAFSEGYGSGVDFKHVANSLFFLRSIKKLAEFYSCSPDYESILAARKKYQPGVIFEKSVKQGNVKAILIDDGFLPKKSRSIKWHSKFTETRKILRIETEAEKALLRNNNFDDFIDDYKLTLKKGAVKSAALKTIIAYRSGLDIESHSAGELKISFARAKKSPRLLEKPILDHLVRIAAGLAVEMDIPFQFHTGFGDSDLDLLKADPLYLKKIIDCPENKGLKIVLLHAGYPFVKNAGWLASIYPYVYVDCGLAVPFLSSNGMKNVMSELIELCPLNKILYSSDAHFIPELYYLGAVSVIETLAAVFDDCVNSRELTVSEAYKAAYMILYQNSCSLYRLYI